MAIYVTESEKIVRSTMYIPTSCSSFHDYLVKMKRRGEVARGQRVDEDIEIDAAREFPKLN